MRKFLLRTYHYVISVAKNDSDLRGLAKERERVPVIAGMSVAGNKEAKHYDITVITILAEEKYSAVKEFFVDSPYADAWKKFEKNLVDEEAKKKDKTETPTKSKEVRCGTKEALALHKKKILSNQAANQKESKYMEMSK